MAKPKVSSPLLTEVLDDVGQRIDDYTRILDATSNDIKAVEKWLSESGIRFEMTVPFMGFSTASLSWSGGKDGKTWRIYYSVYCDGSAEAEEDRPLIETPVKVRLTSMSPLAELVRIIAVQIPSDSLPFNTPPPSSENGVTKQDAARTEDVVSEVVSRNGRRR